MTLHLPAQLLQSGNSLSHKCSELCQQTARVQCRGSCCLWQLCSAARLTLVHQQGYYFTGDGAKRSKDGYITITGRVDDVINVSGHRVGTAEVESALASHGACVEAAVVG